MPDSPAAWLRTAAGRRVLDRLRAEAMHRRRAPLLSTETEHAQERWAAMVDPGGLVEDDVLRLVLMCTHPALVPESASALTLRLVLGVSTYDVARLFLVPEPTMAARITRAKRKIMAAGIPFSVPGAGEAVRLVRAVLGLRPDAPVLVALLALMLLQHSRRDARVGPDGGLVLLADQDRSRWHRTEIDEALALLRSLGPARVLSRQGAAYLLHARIASEHATATTAQETRWDRIVRHYDTLLQVTPTPAARVARAVAVAEAEGPEAGLLALDGVEMTDSHHPAVVRAELLARLGRAAEARAAYEEAISRCRNETELAHLRQRLASV